MKTNATLLCLMFILVFFLFQGQPVLSMLTEAKEEEKAWIKVRLAADQGDASAQHRIARMYFFGFGVRQSYQEAFKFYLLAAEQGHLSAQLDIARMCYYGDGVTKDYNEAFKWWKRAADLGDKSAQNSIGRCYDYGHGVTKDPIEALKWYQMDVDQRHEDEVSSTSDLQKQINQESHLIKLRRDIPLKAEEDICNMF